MSASVLADLAAQHAELGGILAALADDDWRRPTPCEGWDVADVVVHLHQTDDLALAALRGDLDASIEGFMADADGVDAAADLSVAGARGAGPAAVRAGWERAAAALRRALGEADDHRRVQWVAGTLSVRTLAATRLAECWIHTTDVGAALGRVPAPTHRLVHVARLAWRTLPYAFAQGGHEPAGPVAVDLTAPDGDRWAFGLDDAPATVVTGSGADWCRVAGRRLDPDRADLRAEGPDAAAVLRLARTYA